MEEDKKNNKGLMVGIIIFLIICLIAIFYFMFKMTYVGNKKNTIQENEQVDTKNNFDEEEVRKWLNDNSTWLLYFTVENVDFDSETATSKDYSYFLAWYLLISSDKSIDNKNINPTTTQYTYTKEYINSFLDKNFGVKLDKIEIVEMDNAYNGQVTYTEDDNNIYVNVHPFDGAPLYICKLENISFSENQDILIKYNKYEKESLDDNEGKLIGNRYLKIKNENNEYKVMKVYDDI